MENLQGPTSMIRKAAVITLIGFMVVMLGGPAIALVGTLLPFALVGLLVYVPFRLIVLARNGGFHRPLRRCLIPNSCPRCCRGSLHENASPRAIDCCRDRARRGAWRDAPRSGPT